MKKTFILTTLVLSFSAKLFAGAHYPANHCEIFVDKLEVSRGSHGLIAITPYLKVLRERLDSDVEEVGFRNQSTSINHSGTHNYGLWTDEKLNSASPIGDYWTLPWGLAIGSDFGSSIYEGAFYVRTKNGTTYWAKTDKQENFVFDYNAWNFLVKFSNFNYSWKTSVKTQVPELRYYNANNCY